MPHKDVYLKAWIHLNIGFYDRYKRIKASFRNRKLCMFEHVKGKKWENVKKLCPPIKYHVFVHNVQTVHMVNIALWESLSYMYLISKVSQLTTKLCVFCDRHFKKDDNVALLPCMDIVHYNCLKKRYKGFGFFYQKKQSCACGMDVQDMYVAVKSHLIFRGNQFREI